MVETQTYINLGILITLITGFTVVGLVGNDPTHYCLEDKTKAYCSSLSSTNRTCYTGPAKTAGKTCTGTWKEIPLFSENTITPSTEYSSSRTYHCNPNGCIAAKSE